jgi:hypothetical protein
LGNRLRLRFMLKKHAACDKRRRKCDRVMLTASIRVD